VVIGFDVGYLQRLSSDASRIPATRLEQHVLAVHQLSEPDVIQTPRFKVTTVAHATTGSSCAQQMHCVKFAAGTALLE
jgi:hypothetical protein